jgi:hypothetical protein
MVMTESFMVKTVEGNTDLELEAIGEKSLLIKGIIVFNPADDYVYSRVEKTVTGYFRAGGVLGNHLATLKEDAYRKTMLGLLYELGLWRGIPVAQGEKFSLSGIAQAGAIQIVIYEEHEAGDIVSTMPNGRAAISYDYINYGRLSAVADGENIYDVQKSPIEYPNFPYDALVPSKSQITVFGILASDIAKESGGGANEHISKYLKLVRGRKTLWDEDLHGMPMIGITPGADQTDVGKGHADFGNFNDIDQRMPLLFPEPLVFIGGEELAIYLETDVSAGVANLTVVETEIALISRLEPMGV